MKYLLCICQPTWHQGRRQPSLLSRGKCGNWGPGGTGLILVKVTQLQEAEPGFEPTDRQRAHTTKWETEMRLGNWGSMTTWLGYPQLLPSLKSAQVGEKPPRLMKILF